MRRRIRLTGRKQLPRSSVTAKIVEMLGKRLLALNLANEGPFGKFPRDARVLVVLKENKLVELVELGTLGTLKPVAELKNPAFNAPSCQLRVVAVNDDQQGLLLGSTDQWTLHTDNEVHERGKKGILLFKPQKMAPRAWKLDIRDEEYPVVYVDERIPDVSTWVRTDPAFVSSVLPAIIYQIFDEILVQQTAPEADGWMADWVAWAEVLMPGLKPPFGNVASRQEKKEWIENLIDSFCHRYRLSDKLVPQPAEGGVQS